jgi:uncharacterized membrane protein
LLLLLPIHIAAAGIGLVSGAVALTTAKGRAIHRKSGIVFVYSMCAMCASALVAAAARGQTANVLAALMTSYLVITGLMTCCWSWWRCFTGCGASARAPFQREPDVFIQARAVARPPTN